MHEKQAADGLAALGNVTRLKLFRLLVQAGAEGLNMGEMQRLLGIPGSTLNHHAGVLRQAGLIFPAKRGREVVCTADYAAIQDLSEFLLENCCAGVAADSAEDAA